METVGFIGLGHMGSALASRILGAGYGLVVFDIREEATRSFRRDGARVASSPAEVARLTDVVCSSLPGPKEVELVTTGAGGLVEGIHGGSIYVDFSTARPAFIRQLAARFAEHGAIVLDAPLSGGRPRALEGQQEVMISGDAEAIARVRPILTAFADQILYVGDIGTGTVCKLVHNMLMRDLEIILAEGLTLGAKAGVDPQMVWECVRRGLVGRMMTLHEMVPDSVFSGEYDEATYTLALAHKDMALATELAREVGVPMALSSLAEQIVLEGMNQGWGPLSPAVIFRLQEQAAQVELRVPGFAKADVDRFDYAFIGRGLATEPPVPLHASHGA